jgi:mannosyltransferase
MGSKPEVEGATVAVLVGVAGFLVGAAWAGRPSAWYDEAATRSAVVRPVDELPDLLANIDAVHGLYYLVASGWAVVAGDSITALRVLSALGLGATAALTACLARRLATPATSWAAGLSVVLLPGMSWAGVEARSYAWSAALSVLSSLVLVAARERGGAMRWGGYAVVLTVSSWWFLFSVTMVVVHGTALAVADRRVPRGWLAAAAISSAATVPLLVVAFGQRGQVGHIDLTAGEVVVRVLGGQAFTGPAFRSHGDPLWYATGAALAVLATAVVVSGVVRRGRIGRRDPLLLPLAWTWATLPTLAVVGAHLAGGEIYQVRYLTFTAPAVALLVGVGLATYSGGARVLLAAALVLAAVPGVVSHHVAGAKSAEDYRGMAALAASWRADAVVFSGAGSRGIAISYPGPFRATEDVLLHRSPADSGTLFGSNVRAGVVRRADVAGRRILQFQRAGTAGDAYARRLDRLGCRVVAETGRGRYRATLLQC